MKNTILSTIALTCFLFASSSTTFAALNNLYIKTNIPYAKLQEIRDPNFQENLPFAAGIGYNYLDKVRIDLVFDRFFNSQQEQTDTIFVNGFIDIIDINIAKIFIGAGVGCSNIKDITKILTEKQYQSYIYHIGANIQFAPSITAEIAYSYRNIGTETQEFNLVNLKEGFNIVKFQEGLVSVGLRIDL